MQPAYLPWLGYFDRIAASDRFIVLDHVAIDRNSRTKFANRNKVRSPQGWTWLTVPLETKGRAEDLGLDVIAVDNEQSWQAKHWSTLRHCYSKSSHYSRLAPQLQRFYDTPCERLNDLVRPMLLYFLESLGSTVPVSFSSEFGVGGEKDQLIVNLCRHAGATGYISGPFGRSYLDADMFAEAGIDLYFHDYQHPTYQQCWPGFEPCMCILDLLFNSGADAARQILRSPASLNRDLVRQS